jgi:hypothetical protein
LAAPPVCFSSQPQLPKTTSSIPHAVIPLINVPHRIVLKSTHDMVCVPRTFYREKEQFVVHPG